MLKGCECSIEKTGSQIKVWIALRLRWTRIGSDRLMLALCLVDLFIDSLKYCLSWLTLFAFHVHLRVHDAGEAAVSQSDPQATRAWCLVPRA